MARIPPFPIQEPPDNKFPADPTARWLADMIPSEGVVQSSDLSVSERASGAPNLSVDVAAGDAYVEMSIPYGGMRRVRSSATSNSGTPGATNVPDWFATFGTPDLTRPRIDRVVLEIKDDNYDNSGLFQSHLRIVGGVPRSTASLTTLDGAAFVPDNAILLANVLVNAGASAITNTDIDTTVKRRATLVSRDAMTRIQRTVLSADGSFDFLDIPQTYKHLLMIGSVKGAQDNGASPNALQLTFNGDSSAAYDWHSIVTFTDIENGYNFTESVAGPSFNRINRTVGNLGDISGGDTDLAQNLLLYSPVAIVIPNYTSVAAQKVAEAAIGLKGSFDGATFDFERWQENRGAIHWAKQAAIARIQVFARDGTSFETRSDLALYGLG